MMQEPQPDYEKAELDIMVGGVATNLQKVIFYLQTL